MLEESLRQAFDTESATLNRSIWTGARQVPMDGQAFPNAFRRRAHRRAQ
jgi:hypothetical protein